MFNGNISKGIDGYKYEYTIIGKDNKRRYITKSGFETHNSALKAAEESYNKRINAGYRSDTTKPTQIKKLNVTNTGLKILNQVVYGGLVIAIVAGGIKLSKELKEKFPNNTKVHTTSISPYMYDEININNCDVSNIHIILRCAKIEVNEVAVTTSNQLTRLAISNEIISSDTNLESKIENTLEEYQGYNIILINLETKLENATNNKTIIMGDSSNRRTYPSDTLVACINTSCREYNLSPVICSGQATGEGWRLQSYIEEELNNNSLIDNITQFTIDLPSTITEDEIIKNDASSGIVEGIMRWTALDKNARFQDIYYTTKYGDTMQSVAEDFGISSLTIQNNSNINIYKPLNVGDTLSVSPLPVTAQDNVLVNNPCVTSNINEIEPILYPYVVQSGDTVTRIANMYGVKISNILTSSEDPNNIQIGETFYITSYNLYETHEKVNLLNEEYNNQL